MSLTGMILSAYLGCSQCFGPDIELNPPIAHMQKFRDYLNQEFLTRPLPNIYSPKKRNSPRSQFQLKAQTIDYGTFISRDGVHLTDYHHNQFFLRADRRLSRRFPGTLISVSIRLRFDLYENILQSVDDQ